MMQNNMIIPALIPNISTITIDTDTPMVILVGNEVVGNEGGDSEVTEKICDSKRTQFAGILYLQLSPPPLNLAGYWNI